MIPKVSSAPCIVMSPLADRWYMRDQHPPACTCVDCTQARLLRLGRQPSLPQTKLKVRRKPVMRRPRHITHTILITITLLFAFLTGISIMAWLLPTTFNSLGSALIRISGNADIRLNVMRISSDPIVYSICFGSVALVARWFAGKFW